MNKQGWLLPALLALAGVVQAAGDAGDSSAAAAAAAPPASALPPIPAGEENFRIGYTLGYSMGQRISELPDLDTTAFHEGFVQGYLRQAGRLTSEEMQQAFELFQQRQLARMQEVRTKLLADNLAKSNEFLKQNAKRKGVKITKSGLQYEVLVKGKGPSPGASDIVSAHYRGTLPDGTEFDSSAGGDPVEFPLDRVISGWQEGVRLMNRGAKYRFYLPPALGYGEAGAGEGDVIGPNQALVFEVELIDFKPQPPVSEEIPGATDPEALKNMPGAAP